MAPPSDESNASQYCPSCGGAVEESDSYCGSCGHRLAEEPTGGGAAPEENHKQFRRRVMDHVNDGWEIQYDAGDEVALVDREYGSIAIHVLLLMFTGGFGNLLYGWYHYEHSAQKKVIRAHGPENASPKNRQTHTPGSQAPQPNVQAYEYEDSKEDSLSSYGWGLFLAVIAVAIFASSWTLPVKLAAGFACLFMASVVLPPVRRRLDNRQPPTKFGPTTTVDERFISDTDRACSVCLDRIESGVVREYEETYLFAGIPLFTTEHGENLYCKSCREDIYGLDDDTQDRASQVVNEPGDSATVPKGADDSADSGELQKDETAATTDDSDTDQTDDSATYRTEDPVREPET